MSKLPFENRRRETTAKLAALMLANAFIFQEQLSGVEANVKPIRQMLTHRDFIDVTAKHWLMIIEKINYVPIFKVARDILLTLPANQDTDRSVRHLANRSLEIVARKAALRHDLMGRIYHLLLHEAKYLGTYYTSVPAATILLKLALDNERWETKWSDESELRSFKIGDLACGTGTLLMAASQAITDNYVKFKASNNERVEEAELPALHKLIVEEMLFGYDVLASAVHLTASTLALLAPETSFRKMSLYSLPIGRMPTGQISLGSIDYISSSNIETQLDLMSPSVSPEAIGDDYERSTAALPPLDLCVMNPPFVRSVGGNLLFGSMPEKDRKHLQGELARRLRVYNLSASSTAGLGSVFSAVADKHVKEGGRLALVLPAAVMTGVAWNKTRELIEHSYELEVVVSSHDPHRWNFSENTDLSEVLLLARKKSRVPRTTRKVSAKTQFINLWANPTTSVHALAVVDSISRYGAAPIGGRGGLEHGVAEIFVGKEKFGEAIEIPWDDLKAAPWIGGAFAQTNLVRASWFARRGLFYQPGQNNTPAIPITLLKNIGQLGPDRRDIADGFTVATGKTSYPMFRGHNANTVTMMSAKPTGYLAPRSAAAEGRPQRDVGLLWPRAGSIMIAERSRLNTQRLLAVYLGTRALSNVWWPLRLNTDDSDAAKVLTLWLNSTIGLLISIAHRVPTEGPWVSFKKPNLLNLPVLDVTRLSPGQKKQLVGAYDAVAELELHTISQMADDAARADIDDAFSRVLQLPAFSPLRSELAREPVISGRSIDYEAPPLAADQLEFELI